MKHYDTKKYSLAINEEVEIIVKIVAMKSSKIIP